MTKKEIKEYLEIKKKFEEKHFSLTERENILLANMKPNVASRRLKRARILIEICSSFKTWQEDEEFIEKHLRPILFDKSTTKKKVETMFMKARGLYLETPAIQNVAPTILELIIGFAREFPNYGEWKELDVPEGTERKVQFTMKLPIALYPDIFKNTCSKCGEIFRTSFKMTSPIKECTKCYKKGKKKT